MGTGDRGRGASNTLEGGEANAGLWEVMAERVASVGAHVMGRKMFSGGSAPGR